ncbi:NUDIX domain-containing protein [Siphonobacter sp. SORGH_AS_1065]|uniref:NUDIX hydrolase n=1 Tax=Siphonobacter sp. SORGH_AS_1065 TaxID=3041795 RepID=UPI00278AE711|nr:NUDIX domain-containing protein [Siphonobacter sp. SORGH_AS_1065]MDQ1088257.1 isopentenyldiphosphate isomerase [Siphonobacter sp. SORGH_AS_1065]
MELFELYNEQNLPFWQTKIRSDVHRDGDWHRSTEVWVINQNQELLLNLRHPDKDLFANLWDVCIAGHLMPGENYRTAAIREVKEELGIQVPSSALHFVDVWTMDGFDAKTQSFDREFTGVFVWKTQLELSSFTPQAEEIAELKYVSLTEVRQMLENPGSGLPFIPMESIFLNMMDRIETTILPQL